MCVCLFLKMKQNTLKHSNRNEYCVYSLVIRNSYLFGSPDVILCGWLGLKHQLTNYISIWQVLLHKTVTDRSCWRRWSLLWVKGIIRSICCRKSKQILYTIWSILVDKKYVSKWSKQILSCCFLCGKKDHNRSFDFTSIYWLA